MNNVTELVQMTEQREQNEGRDREKDDSAAKLRLSWNHSTTLQNTFSGPELGSDSKRHLDIWCSPSLIRKAFHHLFNSMHV